MNESYQIVSSDLSNIVESAQQGDNTAQRKLFEQFHPKVMAFCLVATHRDRELAMDLCQETFLKAFSKLFQLRDLNRFESWLFSIVANLCRKRLKQEGRKRATLAQLALETEKPLASTSHPQMTIERIQLVRTLVQNIKDPSLQKIIEMRYSEPEYTTLEIAKRLTIPLGTVTVKLVRFRAAVKRELIRQMQNIPFQKEVSA